LVSGYIGEFEIVDDHRGGKIVVELIGRLNKCGVISPRFDLKLGSIEQWTNNLLPSRQFGYIVMTTSLGIMDHEEVISSSFAIACELELTSLDIAGAQKKHRRQDSGLLLLSFLNTAVLNERLASFEFSRVAITR
jgi:hypothetical protein